MFLQAIPNHQGNESLMDLGNPKRFFLTELLITPVIGSCLATFSLHLPSQLHWNSSGIAEQGQECSAVLMFLTVQPIAVLILKRFLDVIRLKNDKRITNIQNTHNTFALQSLIHGSRGWKRTDAKPPPPRFVTLPRKIAPWISHEISFHLKWDCEIGMSFFSYLLFLKVLILQSISGSLQNMGPPTSDVSTSLSDRPPMTVSFTTKAAIWGKIRLLREMEEEIGKANKEKEKKK